MDATTTQADQTSTTPSDAAGQAKSAVQDAATQAQEKLHDAAGQAKEQAAQAGTQAKGRIRSQVDTRSTEFGERAGSTAGDLRSVSEQLRSQGKEQPAKIADNVADQVDRAAGYLKDSDADRLLHDLEDFGRQRPWAVIAGGLTLGFIASRVLKTSSADRYATRSTPGSAAPIPGRATGGYTTPSTGYAGGAPRTTTPSPLDDVARDAGRYAAPAGGAATSPSGSPFGTGATGYGGTAGTPEPLPPTDTASRIASRPLGSDTGVIGESPVTPTHRDRENGVGSDGLG